MMKQNYMKAVLLLSLFLMVSLTSCEKDKDDPLDPNDLPGLWMLSGAETYGLNVYYMEYSPGSTFDFKTDGSLYVNFANSNSEIYQVALMPKSGVYSYSYENSMGMLYLESSGVGKGMIPYHYKIIDGRLYIYGLDNKGNEVCNWQFKRQ